MFFLNIYGSDDVNSSRGIRISMHSRLDSIIATADTAEDISSIICRGKSASIPPVQLKLYHFVGTDFARKLYVPLYPSVSRTMKNQRYVFQTQVKVMQT